MAKKFGTFQGVFVPSFEAILGTVLFLLLPALTGDVGLLPMVGIILLAHSVTIATGFSLADTATNLNQIGGGGMYALAKRSLGRAFGGSIGIQLFLAQAASIGFYCVGFAEPLQPILAPILAGKFAVFAGVSPEAILLQKQIIATSVFAIFFIIVLIGADFTLKIQTFILVILSASILVIFFSPMTGMQHDGVPLFRHLDHINLAGKRPLTMIIFFFTFTQFFPAVTGIDAGVGMSGDLKTPKKSLVRGTFSAIFITLVIYLATAFVFSLMNPDLLVTGYNGNNPNGMLLTELLGLNLPMPFRLLGMVVMAGILFATSSSALSVFMTSPRTAQQLARDNTLPRMLGFLKYDFKKGGNEPRFAVLVSAVIGIAIIWMGSINTAAMIVGILYLVVYGWVNGSAFLERVSRNPNFRPTFKGHWLISLYGFLSCIIAIALFDWKIGILIFATQALIFWLILRFKAKGKLEGVWWGLLFTFIQKRLKTLRKIIQGTKNWRPILTAFTFLGKKNNPDAIYKIAHAIADYQGMVNINILVPEKYKEEVSQLPQYDLPFKMVVTDNNNDAIQAILQSSHIAGIHPNTFLLEYKRDLATVAITRRILDKNCNLLILKNGQKLDQVNKIDIWWRGLYNANLMALLAYIIKNSLDDDRDAHIRILFRQDKDSSIIQDNMEIQEILDHARINGEIIAIPYVNEPIIETMEKASADADLLMLGLPGNYDQKGGLNIFNLNEVFLDNEIEKYNDLPPILFVKSARKVNLLEED